MWLYSWTDIKIRFCAVETYFEYHWTLKLVLLILLVYIILLFYKFFAYFLVLSIFVFASHTRANANY